MRCFAEVVGNKVNHTKSFFWKPITHWEFKSKEEHLKRLKKAFVGIVVILGTSYNIQSIFKIEGYFSIKVSPLRTNIFLLEENKQGEINDLNMANANTTFGNSFSIVMLLIWASMSVRKWREIPWSTFVPTQFQ